MKLGSIVTVRGESQHSVIDTGQVARGYKYRTEGHKYFVVSRENEVLGFRPEW